MVRGYRTFSEFRQSGEGIATNILSERLKRLEESGILTAEADAADARRITYRLTEKGIGLAPVVLELLIWGAKYEDSAAPGDLEQTMGGKSQFLEEVRRRWREDDRTPLLPAFRETDKLQERNR
jgi:DNA-binding HxlR family transcriptional regulator